MCAESNGASFMKIYIDHKWSYDHFLYTEIDIIIIRFSENAYI